MERMKTGLSVARWKRGQRDGIRITAAFIIGVTVALAAGLITTDIGVLQKEFPLLPSRTVEEKAGQKLNQIELSDANKRGDVASDVGRQSLAIAGLIFGLAGFLGAGVIFWLVRSTRRDREIADRLAKENEELGSRAQHALARREMASR